MRIAIVGTGAMGSVYAGLMAEAGHEVWAVDTWAAHVAAINKNGLHVTGASGDRVIGGIRAVAQVDAAAPCDLYVIATKVSGVAAAARAVAAHMQRHAMVLTIQNGLGAGERICAHMPAEPVLLGIADGFGASVPGPGHVHHNDMKRIRLGEPGGGITERLERLATLWRECGFRAEACANIHQRIWEKFLCNVAVSAPCTLFDCTVGELMRNPDSRFVAHGCTREAYRCGVAAGITFPFPDPVSYVNEFAARMPEASPSMRLDHLHNRRSEIDAINGMVPVLGKRWHIETPYNATLAALVRARESRFPH